MNNGGTVKNLNVNGTVTVTNEDSIFVYVGGVVGYAGDSSGTLSTVENCSFAGEVTGTGHSIYVGGVVGKADNITVRGCFNSGTVTVNGQNYSYAGGVVGSAGYAANYPSTVENCYFLQDEGINSGLNGIGYDNSSSSASNTGATGKDSAAFASGEVVYLLQGSQAGTVWVQKLLAQGNSVPVLAASLSSEEAAQSTVYRVSFTAGTSSTTFSPDETCTRAQIVTFLYRVYG